MNHPFRLLVPVLFLSCSGAVARGTAIEAPSFHNAPAAFNAPVMTLALSNRILAAHNNERARFDVPPLVWDESLAISARDWAQELARSGRFEHSSPGVRHQAGENLFMGTSGAYPVEAMVGNFLDERRDFTPGTFPAIARDGDWHNVGHYTQIIWRQTRQVGCAIAKGAHDDYLVCRYWPAGNVYGQRVP